MKKLSVYAVLLSLGLFVVGCAPPKAAEKKTEAPATEAAKDMPAEGDAKPAEGDAKAAEGDAKPAAEPAPEKPAEETK